MCFCEFQQGEEKDAEMKSRRDHKILRVVCAAHGRLKKQLLHIHSPLRPWAMLWFSSSGWRGGSISTLAFHKDIQSEVGGKMGFYGARAMHFTWVWNSTETCWCWTETMLYLTPENREQVALFLSTVSFFFFFFFGISSYFRKVLVRCSSKTRTITLTQKWNVWGHWDFFFKQNLLVSSSSSSSSEWMKLLFAGAEPSPQQQPACSSALGCNWERTTCAIVSLRPKKKKKNFKNTYVALAPGCPFLQHKVMWQQNLMFLSRALNKACTTGHARTSPL